MKKDFNKMLNKSASEPVLLNDDMFEFTGADGCSSSCSSSCDSSCLVTCDVTCDNSCMSTEIGTTKKTK